MSTDTPTGTPSSPPIQPTLPAPADLANLALANLTARAQKGERLTPDEWARLDTLAAQTKPDPLGDLLAALQEQTALARASGGKPTSAALRLARLALLREQGAHVWPDAGSCAADLGVSVQTVRNWCDELGIPSARCPIPKADLYRALWQRDRQTTLAPAPQSDADQREQALRIAERQARLDERTGRLQAEAADAGRAAVIGLVSDLRTALTTRLPALLADVLATDQDRLGWESTARRIITDHLLIVRADLEHTTPPNPPEPTHVQYQDETPEETANDHA